MKCEESLFGGLCGNALGLSCKTDADCDFGSCQTVSHIFSILFQVLAALAAVFSCVLCFFGVKINWIDHPHDQVQPDQSGGAYVAPPA